MKYIFEILLAWICFWTVRDSLKARRRFLRIPENNQSEPGKENWRWSLPSKALRLNTPIHIEDSSILIFETPDPVKVQGLNAVMGYGFMAAALGLLVYLMLLPERWFMGLFWVGLLVSVGWPALMFNAYVGRIDLGPNEVSFYLVYGIWLVREFRFSRAKFARYGLECHAQKAPKELEAFVIKMKRFNQNYRWLFWGDLEQGLWIESQLQTWMRQS